MSRHSIEQRLFLSIINDGQTVETKGSQKPPHPSKKKGKEREAKVLPMEMRKYRRSTLGSIQTSEVHSTASASIDSVSLKINGSSSSSLSSLDGVMILNSRKCDNYGDQTGKGSRDGKENSSDDLSRGDIVQAGEDRNREDLKSPKVQREKISGDSQNEANVKSSKNQDTDKPPEGESLFDVIKGFFFLKNDARDLNKVSEETGKAKNITENKNIMDPEPKETDGRGLENDAFVSSDEESSLGVGRNDMQNKRSLNKEECRPLSTESHAIIEKQKSKTVDTVKKPTSLECEDPELLTQEPTVSEKLNQTEPGAQGTKDVSSGPMLILASGSSTLERKDIGLKNNDSKTQHKLSIKAVENTEIDSSGYPSTSNENKQYPKSVDPEFRADIKAMRNFFDVRNDELRQEQIQELKDAFALYDKKEKGVVNSKELVKVLRCTGMNPTENEMLVIMADLDVEGGGDTTLQDLIDVMMDKFITLDSMEEMETVFRVFDRDGNGYINAAELKYMMCKVIGNVTDDEVEELMEEADVDGDGKINYIEFVKMMVEDYN